MSSLIRVLRNSRYSLLSSMRHTSYQPGSRSFTGDTEEQPVPKHIYQYLYVFEYYPEALGAFNVYSMKRDQFAMEHFFKLENFDFDYEGQQWHIGSYGSHLFFLFLPLILFGVLSYDDWKNEKIKGNRNKNYCQHGGFMPNELVFLENEAPIDSE